MTRPSICGGASVLLMLLLQMMLPTTDAFSRMRPISLLPRPSSSCCFVLQQEPTQQGSLAATFDFGDDDEEDDDEEDAPPPKLSRWDRLNPKVKARIVQTGQERAIANKQKREPAQDKKRRLMMYVKEKQREKKKASRVQRTRPFAERTPLAEVVAGDEVEGVVISLTPFGAYVDIGTECDGLLHVSQISRETFVEHPKQVFSPGDKVTVRVRSTNVDRKKLHLTMLPVEVVEEELAVERSIQLDEDDRIPLDDVLVDDELWGEIQRVTNYGAYVEVGAVVSGFLHFMDHPLWEPGVQPREIAKAGDRVRVWVLDVDQERTRIKLTANRPRHLPGPRREIDFR